MVVTLMVCTSSLAFEPQSTIHAYAIRCVDIIKLNVFNRMPKSSSATIANSLRSLDFNHRNILN